jgi:hypothetical protein
MNGGWDMMGLILHNCASLPFQTRLGLWSQVRASRQTVPGHLGAWGAATNGNPRGYGSCRVGGPTLILPWKDSVVEPFHLWGFRVSKHHTSWDLRWSQGASRVHCVGALSFLKFGWQLWDRLTSLWANLNHLSCDWLIMLPSGYLT